MHCGIIVREYYIYVQQAPLGHYLIFIYFCVFNFGKTYSASLQYYIIVAVAVHVGANSWTIRVNWTSI